MSSDTNQPGYPDILGYITGNIRYETSWVELALAVRPRVARGGRDFEVLALHQNITTVPIDITLTLQVPAQDARKQSGRFVPRTGQFNFMLGPAEVGYATLPVLCAADTAAGDAYKLSAAFNFKSTGKPGRVSRRANGHDTVDPEFLSDSQLAQLQALKKLSFSAARRGLTGTVLEAPFSVLSGQRAPETELQARWVSLWKLSDHRDEGVLLRQYADLLQSKVLPQLKCDRLYAALYQTTNERFGKAGYQLQSAEAHYIAKLLVVILEMAAPVEDSYDYLGDERYNVTLALKKIDRVQLPSWCKGMLKHIEDRSPWAERPVALLAGALYDELIRDAMLLGFQMITRVTGETVGSEEDARQYTESWIARLKAGKPDFTFADVYLPLVIGGAIVFERAIATDEKIGEQLTALSLAVKSRFNEVNADNELVYRMAQQVVDRALQKYGYRV